MRTDGWPQATIVGYANDGILIYFMISRTSQKFANIQRDNRVSVAILTIIDYSKGFGHSDILTVAPGGVVGMTAERDDDWGFGETVKPTT